VLPILLPALTGNSKEKKLAYFYQFKDNNIYNFDFTDTFIEELIEKACVLEVSTA
jgi:hypothetical protein